MNKESRRGQAPFGFRWRSGSLEVVETEAYTRKLAFDYFVELQSKGGVARKLNDGGRYTRRNGKWSDMQVGRILVCSSAIGRYVIGPQTTSRGRSSPDIDAAFVSCEAIVPLDLWKRVSKILAGQIKKTPPVGPVSPKAERLLAGQVFCDCGGQMILPSDDQKYGCPACFRKIGLEELETVLVEDLSELLSGDPRFRAALDDNREPVPVEFELAEAERELSEIHGERTRVEQLLIEKVISTQRFGDLDRDLQARIDAATRRVAALDARRVASPPKGAGAPDASKAFGPKWRKLSATARNRIAKAFVERINVGADGVEITYLFGHSASKDATLSQQISAPTNQPGANILRDAPVFVRLPKAGGRCQYTGLSRAKLNDLILPGKRNGFSPPVKSKSLRKTGSLRGVRLILLESLMAYVSTND